MSQTNYDRVKLASTHKIAPDAIARELNVALKEVHKAILASNYEVYAS